MSSTTQQNGDEASDADLVFEGGGVKGIGLAGAYCTLYDRGYRPQCVAGTSAGAITAALVAVGYDSSELSDIVLNRMEFPRFQDPAVFGRLGIPGEIAQFLSSRGIHSGDYFLGWMRDLLKAKGKTKFGDLRNAGETDPKRAYKLRVIASDLSARSMLVLPQDATRLGLDPDELSIADAVRMSMSIPVFFKPVVQNGHTIVDGGLLSNFPVWLFDAPEGTMPRFPTFGMLLVAPKQTSPLMTPSARPDKPPPIGSPVEFAKAIAETMMEAHDRFYIDQASYARTIPIDTLGVGTTEFAIKKPRAQALFESGAEAAEQFLATWNFDEYQARFRTGQAPTRRETVAPVPSQSL